MKSEEEKEELLEEKFDEIKNTLIDNMIAGSFPAISNPFMNNDLRTHLGIPPAESLKAKHYDTSDGIDAAAYMGMKTPTFELNGTVKVKRIIYNNGKFIEDIVELPFPVYIPEVSNKDMYQCNIIKELIKYLKEYREVLQILSNKNILVKEHFGIYNLSFSLTDEELDKFMTCLEKLNKGE